MNLKATVEAMIDTATAAGAPTVLVAIANHEGNDVWYMQVHGERIRIIGLTELLRRHVMNLPADAAVTVPKLTN
jgi:hypothetical protein